MPRVAVVTDSTAALPGSVAAATLHQVGLHVVLDGVEHAEPDLLALPEDELVTMLAEAKKVGTSRPSPAAFLDAYQQAAEAGADAIVSAHLSGELSGTVEGAILAASRAPVPVEVIDTRQAGMALGLAVLAGCAVAADGGAAGDVAHAVRSRAAGATSVFYVDTLDYLRRGGRVTTGAHLVGSALSIKPILTLDDGAIEPLARVRTAAKAVDRLVTEALAACTAAGGHVDVAVQSLGADARADDVVDRLRAGCPTAAVDRYRLGPVLGAHVGPGTVAVVVSACAR